MKHLLVLCYILKMDQLTDAQKIVTFIVIVTAKRL